jgi:hypothetical protein
VIHETELCGSEIPQIQKKSYFSKPADFRAPKILTKKSANILTPKSPLRQGKCVISSILVNYFFWSTTPGHAGEKIRFFVVSGEKLKNPAKFPKSLKTQKKSYFRFFGKTQKS